MTELRICKSYDMNAFSKIELAEKHLSLSWMSLKSDNILLFKDKYKGYLE